jgi:hypothetical protein
VDERDEVSLPIIWAGVEETPIFFVNAFVSQFDADAFIVTLGQMTPPALVGTPDEIHEQASQLSYVAVKPVVRLGLTRTRMEEFITILQANLDQFLRAATLKPGDPRDDPSDFSDS